MESIDCLIIGAGPAGMTAALYLKRSNRTFKLLDFGAPGGKLNVIAKIDNYPGFNSISGPDLAMTFMEQISNLGIEVEYGKVGKLEKDQNNYFHAFTDEGEIIVKSILIATGVSPKEKKAPGEKEFLGKGVSYCATCDGAFFKGKNIALIGSDDRAVEEALYLANIVGKVYFASPKDIESTDEHLKSLLSLDNVELLPGYSLKEVKGESKVSSAILINGAEELALDVSGVFPLEEELGALDFLSNLKIDSDKGFLLVDENKQTNVSGLFAAGDVTKKKLRQVVNACGDGAEAATSIISYVRSFSK